MTVQSKRTSTAVIVFIALGLLVSPVGLLLAAAVQYAVYPGCYGKSTPYLTGSHLGFHVGMSRVEAAAVVGAQHAKQLKEGEVFAAPGYRTPKSAEELAAISPVRNWYIRRGGSLCLMSVRRTVLHFRNDRIVQIDDELSYAGI
jgi:hypothetical protein